MYFAQLLFEDLAGFGHGHLPDEFNLPRRACPRVDGGGSPVQGRLIPACAGMTDRQLFDFIFVSAISFSFPSVFGLQTFLDSPL
jgi:hypothetical protein